MSKGNRQSLMMLSIISGVFYTIVEKKMFARVDIRDLCENTDTLAIATIKNWEVDNSPLNWEKTAIPIMKKWDEMCDGKDHDLVAASYVYISSRLLVDMQGKINNKYKLGLLKKLEEPIRVMENFTDPEGKNFQAYELGDKLLDMFYDLIDWRW